MPAIALTRSQPRDILNTARTWAASRSTRQAMLLGGVAYLAYAALHQAWGNPVLVAAALLLGFLLPGHNGWCGRLEQWTADRIILVTAAKLMRGLAVFALNVAALLLLRTGGVIVAPEALGGIVPVAALATLAALGVQFFAMALYHRGVGDLQRNTLIGHAVTVVLTAAALAGMPGAAALLAMLALLVGGAALTVGLLSDLRARFYPRGGVGLFFGTFNPFHQSHAAVIRRAMAERGLDKVIVHPTIVPRLHAGALARGEITVARVENGLQVYERTAKADANVDYFPTGRQFFAPEARRAMIELALADNDLGDRVELAYFPEIYARAGFHGVIRELKRRNKGRPLHGIHGNDLGAMYLRTILDECGWIYPMPMERKDDVSATAIRGGAAGMTSPSVAAALEGLRADAAEIAVAGRRYRNERGALILV